MFYHNRFNIIPKLSIILSVLFFSVNAITVLTKNSSQDVHLRFPLLSGKTTSTFGITTIPGSKASGIPTLKSNNGSVSSLKSLKSGWMGNKYVQWYSFSTNLSNSDTITLTLHFKTPVFKSSQTEQISGPLIEIPLIAKVTPPIKRSSIPSHNYSYGVRIEVNEDGIYSLSGNELKALGVPISTIKTRQFKLYCENIEVPIFIAGSDDGKLDNEDEIYFYGKYLRGEINHYTSYSYDNSYWLTWEGSNPGLRFAEVSGGSEKDPDDYSNLIINKALPFTDTIHVEEDNDIRWLGDLFDVGETNSSSLDNDSIDNWYWGFAGDKELTHYTFRLPSPNTSDNTTFTLRVALGGLSDINDIDNDHNFSIHLNDDPTDINAIWDGQSEFIVESNNIPIDRLKNGENKITLIKNQPDSIPDRVALNWCKFIYERNFKSLDNNLLFKTTKEANSKLTSYTLNNFTKDNITLWDISNYRKFKNISIKKVSFYYSAVFYDSLSSSASYLALSEDNFLKPSKMKMDSVHNSLFMESPDYIVISTDTLLKVMEPLIEFHKNRGLNVSTFDIQDIYNTFSYGIHNPESIKDAIKFLYSRNITNPPKYLLLGGDASHDMYKQRRHLNVVPTHLSRTPNWGPSADDGYFTKVNGDDNFMDLFVGRLPAETPLDMKIMVDKIVNYSSEPEIGLWRDNMILAGGFEKNFTQFNNEAVSSIIDNKINIYRMDADPNSQYYIGGSSASNLMADYMNTGVYLINFLGHGGGNVWSDSKYFSYSDLEKLHNSKWSSGGRLPIVFSFTCLTGFFESVFYKSLGEEFLRNSSDGAICFYGAAGYTRRNIDIQMSRTLLQNGFDGNFSTVGELTNFTEIVMLATNESEALPLINQYNLLGDPALPWNPAPKKTDLTLVKAKLNGTDTLSVSGVTSFTGSGQTSIEVKSGSNLWDKKIVDVANGAFSTTFKLKENATTAVGQVRSFSWNDSTTEYGFEEFSKNSLSLNNIKLSPEIPIIGTAVSINCNIDLIDTTEIPSVQCLYTVGEPAQNNYNFADSAFVFMTKDTISGLWKTTTPIVVPNNDVESLISPHLVLQFKTTGSLGVSPFYTFKVKGIADLTLLSSNTNISYFNDSLRLSYSILNSGTESAFSPSILFYTNSSDTLLSKTINDTINAGETKIDTIAIKDISGSYEITGIVNNLGTVTELNNTNNAIAFPFKTSFKDLLVPTDTLKSLGNGIIINPVSNLSSQRRVFLFYDTIDIEGPLLSNSKFLSSGNDGYYSFSVDSRPALLPTDSLKWTFFANADTSRDTSKISSIFTYNKLNNIWSLSANDRDTTNSEITIHSISSEPHAPAHFYDKSGPDIRAYVNGKEVIYVDYVAKDMPFNLMFSDSSGIDPATVSVSINGTKLTSDQLSAPSTNERSRTLSITAYPPVVHSIDTLNVSVSDLAGNESTRNFIYRPGKNLEIKFFSCHPNPFAARKGDVIRFAYLLTDVATSVEMTIYTIAGRKVWKWKSDRQVSGYQEIRWDGTTANNRIAGKGYRIANGTYYAKLVVKNSNRKQEKIIRIAKLEGY